MSDLNTRMPSGSDVTQRTDEQPAFSADLLELFFSPAFQSCVDMETGSSQQRAMA
ncbi:hypothetical protein [Alteromonas macleodii]|uniref:hypothetical protein n=1 Tax=Alteromonas macleodii TaxID=28108 RepID=UPI00313ADD32